MIDRRPRQFLAVWSDDGKSVKGSTFEESLFVDGAFWKNELTTVPPESFADFGAMFSSDLQAKNDTLETDKKALESQISELQKQVEELQKFRPYNPRIIDASAFFDRITKDEFAKLSTSEDTTLATIAKTIIAYKTNDWPVVFESPEMVGMLAYLVGVGFLTEERKAELVADATQAEAYDAD
jgi:hypothetical protein